MFAARLVAYNPDGDRLPVTLADPVSWDASFAFNDVGSLTLSYATLLEGRQLLDGPVEIAVQVSDGTQWVEPRNGRFVAAEDSSDPSADFDVPSFTFRSYATLMDRAMIISATKSTADRYDSDGKRNFLSATPGQILLSVLQEARSEYSGLLPALTTTFSASKDSRGDTWANLTSVAYEPGMSMLDVAGDLASYGLIDWWLEGRDLVVVNAGSTAVDRNIRLNLTDVMDSPVRGSWEGMYTHIRVEGKDGRIWERPVPGANVPHGAKVKVIANNSVSTDGTALSIINQEIQLATKKRTEYTRSIAVFDRFPMVDYQLGDTVEAKDATNAWERMRIFELGLEWEADGEKNVYLGARLTLNDRFVDAEVRQAKRMKGIVHGATQTMGDGGIPSRSDKAIPAAPQGVAANSLGYWADAIPLSSVDVSWQAVTADVDGLALNGVEAYEVRVGGQTKRVSGTSAGFDGLQPSRIYEVTVRAISTTGIAGKWSTRKEVLTAYPLEKLDPPTAPILTSENGALSVDWDGKLQPASGNPYTPPKHFSHVLVEVQKVGSSAWTKYARDQGTVLVGLEAGSQWRVRLYAVDVLGNESAASAVSTITITSQAQQALARADEAGEEAQKAKSDALAAKERADDAFTGAPGSAAAQALTAANSKSRNWYGVNPPTREQGLAVGDSWFNGSRWQTCLTVPTSGAPTWRDMTPGEGYVDAVNIGRGTVGDLTVGRLSGINSQWQYSAINTLVTDQVFVGEVLARQIVVAADDLIPDGSFSDTTLRESRLGASSTGWFFSDVGDGPNGVAARVALRQNVGDNYSPIRLGRSSNAFRGLTPVTPGTRVRLSVWVRTYAGVKWNWGYNARLRDGTTAWRTTGLLFTHPTTGMRHVTAEWVIPDDVAEIAFAIQINPTSETYPWAWFAQPSAKPMVGTTMIEPNAITTPLIAAGQIVGDHMSVGALDAFRIRSPLFESVATANRGIKWVGDQFVAWDNSGKEMFRLSGNTGEINGMTITGGVIRTAASGQRFTIGTSTAGNPGMWVYDSANTTRLSYGFSTGGDPGIWMYDASGVERLRFVSSGILTMTAANGKQAFRLSAVNDTSAYVRSDLVGPVFGTHTPFLRMGRMEIDGVQTAYSFLSGGYTDSSPDTAYVRVAAGGSWWLGSGTRGRISMDNSSGELILYPRSNLLSLYGIPNTTSTGMPLTQIISASGKPTTYRQTSLRAAKTNIEDIPENDIDRLMELRPRVFHDRTAWEEYAKGLEAAQLQREGLTPRTGLEIWEGTAKPRPIYGFIAEEVVETLPNLGAYNGDGSLAGVQYDRTDALILAWLQKHWPALLARVEQLEKANPWKHSRLISPPNTWPKPHRNSSTN